MKTRLPRIWNYLILLPLLHGCAESTVSVPAVPSATPPGSGFEHEHPLANDDVPSSNLETVYVRGGHGLWRDTVTVGASGQVSRQYGSDGGGYTLTGTALRAGTGLCIRPVAATGDSSKDEDMCFELVPWGGRQYLVESERMLDFCNRVNAGEEPRATELGSTLLRAGDWTQGVEGLPTVPPAWSGFLLAEEVNAHIASDAGGRYLWIDVGSEAGLRAGMCLWILDVPLPAGLVAMGAPAMRDTAIEVVLVEQQRSLARLVYGQRLEYALQPGFSVSSKPSSR
jgi:hypothetical protein